VTADVSLLLIINYSIKSCKERRLLAPPVLNLSTLRRKSDCRVCVLIGNEMADQLARAGSDHPLLGPEPACDITIGVAKKAVRDWMSRKHQEYWESLTGLKTGKGTYTRALC
jgi:hypothetical protein